MTVKKMFDRHAILSYRHNPDSTNATIVTPDGGTTKRSVDMRNFGGLAVVAMTSVSASSSGITKLEIVAAENELMTENLTVIKDSGTVAADAVGDLVRLEVSTAEIHGIGRASGLNLRYAAARLTCSNSGDEAVVTYIRHWPRWQTRGLTENVIS